MPVTDSERLPQQMAVLIEFFGGQRLVTKKDSIAMPVTENTRVSDALAYVKKLYPSLPLEDGMILMTVNQEMAAPDRKLRANDTVLFLPLIGGG